MQVVQRGYFVDWRMPEPVQPPQPIRTSQELEQEPRARTVPVPDSVPKQHSQGLVATNAQARLEMGGYGPRMTESVSILRR